MARTLSRDIKAAITAANLREPISLPGALLRKMIVADLAKPPPDMSADEIKEAKALLEEVNQQEADLVRRIREYKLEALHAAYAIPPGPDRWQHLAAQLAMQLYPGFETTDREPKPSARKNKQWTSAEDAKLISAIETKTLLMARKNGGKANVRAAATAVAKALPEYKGRKDLHSRYYEAKRRQFAAEVESGRRFTLANLPKEYPHKV